LTYGTVNARDDMVTKIQAAWQASEFSDVVIYGDNLPDPNLDEVAKFCNYEFVFNKSVQVTIAAKPVDRTWGQIEFGFGAREGTGSRSLRVMLDYMKDEFKAATIGHVKTLIPSPGAPTRSNGWVIETLYVPFYFDSMDVAFHP